MTRILFICHGNICRSTMAQFVLQYLVNGTELENKVKIDSMATSTEETGNGPHRGTVRKLQSVGIPVLPHRARQFRFEDYENWDMIIGMDEENYRNLMRLTHGDREQKVSYLLDFAPSQKKDIQDPWYTGNFDQTYEDVRSGCEGLIEYLNRQYGL